MSTKSSLFYETWGEPGTPDFQVLHIFEEPGWNCPSPGIWLSAYAAGEDGGDVLIKIHDLDAFAKAAQEAADLYKKLYP